MNITETPNSTRRTVAHSLVMSIKVMVATSAIVLGGAAAGITAADAGQPATHCKVVSTTTQTQAAVTGVKSRTVTVQKCRGKVSTTYSAWH